MTKRWVFPALLIFVLILRLGIYFTKPSEYKSGDSVRINVRVTNEPVRYEYSQYLKLKEFKLYLPLYPEVNYGDSVIVEGEVDIKYKVIDIVGYELGMLRDLRLKDTRLIEISKKSGALYKLRSNLLSVYQQSLPQPHASLVAGVTIGSKSDIPVSFWEKLKASGTAHVVVASGMNVSLVAGFLMHTFLTFMSRKKAILFTLVGVWSYAVISGFDAPIVRAAVMGSIAFTAVALGRLNYAWRALFVSVFLMLLSRPEWVTDIGFLLSFTATASIMYFQKPIKIWADKIKLLNKLGGIKDDLVTTLAAQIGVAPILFLAFGQFSLLSPFINTAVLWTIPLITIFGMVGGLMGLIYVPLGQIILFAIYPLTLWFVTVIELFV